MRVVAIPKADFVLGRMHIDIDLRRIDIQIDDVGGLTAVVQHVGVGLAHRVGESFITNDAAVDVEILHVGAAARKRRQPDPTAQIQILALSFESQRILDKFFATQQGDSTVLFVDGLCGFELFYQPSVVPPAESDIEVSEGLSAYRFINVIEFSFFGAQKLAARRDVVEQVVDTQRRTD